MGNMCRLSIDIDPDEHRRIKAFAALYGKTLKDYVLECVRKRVDDESAGLGKDSLQIGQNG